MPLFRRLAEQHLARRSCRARSTDGAGGFTLVELMVVVLILAALAIIAIPALSKQDYEGKVKAWARRVAQDLQTARYQAAAMREDRVVKFTAIRAYELLGEVPGSGTQTLVKRMNLPEQVKVRAIADCLALDNLPAGAGGGNTGTSCATPASFTAAQLKFSATRAMLLKLGAGAEASKSATIFLESANGTYKARVVIYRTTGNVRYYENW